MAAADSGEPPPSEDEIDAFTMPRALKLCRKYNIQLGETKELYIIKWLIKYHLKCKGKERSEAVSFLAVSGDHDKTRRAALAEVYNDVIEYTRHIVEVDDPVVEELKKMFPSMCDTLAQQKKKVLSEVAPVLVLGETGSGKSSFINLLLGEEILPSSLLSNTHVICEIRYCGDGNKSSARLHKAGEEKMVDIVDEADSKSQFTEELAKHLQMLDPNKKAVYRLAEIYLPCDILKSGLLIVDSPGIGETKEMTNMVLNYMLNACAFIYIIDSTNAGGMQMRVKDLVKRVYRKALLEQKICRPESAIFVCNKWDEVSMQDRKDVWEDTKKRVKDVWPECKESQIIRFSTMEALFIQKKGAVSPTFEIILNSINQLVPVGHEVQLLKGYRYLENFLGRCIFCFDARLSQMNLSQEDRELKRKVAKDRLNHLKNKLTSFFDEQTKFVKGEIDKIAGQLKEFVDEQSNLERVCKFSDGELPKRKNWDEAAVEIRNKVYTSLRSVIKQWEAGEKQFGDIARKLESAFEKEFPTFSKEICDTENFLSCPTKVDMSLYSEEAEFGLLPKFIDDRIGGLSMGTKVMLGIGLSPVLLVGMIVRLPVYGFQHLDKVITKHNMEKEFRAAENDKEKLKEVCEKYARKTVANITDKMNLREVINEDMQPLLGYLKNQQKRMEDQIQSDLDMLRGLRDEERKDEDIRKIYEPIKAKFEILQRYLNHYLIIYLPSYLGKGVSEVPQTVLEKTDRRICFGFSAEIFLAKSEVPNLTEGRTEVCIRFPKEKISVSQLKHFISISEAYKTIRQENIVYCYGLWNPELGSGRLCQVLEPLHSSLREYASTVDFDKNRENNSVRAVKEIVTGLNFLHDRQFVHFDLSLDTVAVDARGKVKLTNICQEQEINIKPVVTDGKVCVFDYIHIDPKFFKNKDRVIYHVKDDMYGVGILMWELWTGQPVVEPDALFEIEQVLQQADAYTASGEFGKSSDSKCSANRGPSPKTEGAQTSSLMSVDGRKRSKAESPKKDITVSEQSDAIDEDHFGDDSVDRETFQTFLKRFRPTRTKHFELCSSKNQYDCTQGWWKTLNLCLDGEINSKELLQDWKDYLDFPTLSILCKDNHF